MTYPVRCILSSSAFGKTGRVAFRPDLAGFAKHGRGRDENRNHSEDGEERDEESHVDDEPKGEKRLGWGFCSVGFPYFIVLEQLFVEARI